MSDYIYNFGFKEGISFEDYKQHEHKRFVEFMMMFTPYYCRKNWCELYDYAEMDKTICSVANMRALQERFKRYTVNVEFHLTGGSKHCYANLAIKKLAYEVYQLFPQLYTLEDYREIDHSFAIDDTMVKDVIDEQVEEIKEYIIGDIVKKIQELQFPNLINCLDTDEGLLYDSDMLVIPSDFKEAWEHKLDDFLARNIQDDFSTDNIYYELPKFLEEIDRKIPHLEICKHTLPLPVM